MDTSDVRKPANRGLDREEPELANEADIPQDDTGDAREADLDPGNADPGPR